MPYQGSESLKTSSGQPLSEQEKLAKDKEEAQKLADGLLDAARGEVRLANGKSYQPAEQKREGFRQALRTFIERGVREFNRDNEPGLDEQEWKQLEEAINKEAERWLEQAKEAEGIRGIENLKEEDLQSKKTEIGAIISRHEQYALGDWKEINKEIAALFNIQFADMEESLCFGDRVIALVNAKFSDYDCGEKGKIGPKTMRGLKLLLGPEVQAPQAAPPAGEAAPDSQSPAPGAAAGAPVGRVQAPAGAGGAVDQGAPQAPADRVQAPPQGDEEQDQSGDGRRIFEGSSVEDTRLRTDIPHTSLPRESAGFGRRFEANPGEGVLDGFSTVQKREMLQTLMSPAEGREPLSQEQGRRLLQVDILASILQSISKDIEHSRTWGEWFAQVGERDASTGARKKYIDDLIASLDETKEDVQRNPQKTVNDLVSWKVKRVIADCKRDLQPFIDSSGNIVDAQSHDEMLSQHLALLKFLREGKDYAAAEELVENVLFADRFERKRTLFSQDKKNRLYDKALAKIYKMFTPDVMWQYRKKNWGSDEITRFQSELAKQDADREMNKEIREWDNGRPFAGLQGKEREIMETYRDMTGAGGWNIADSKWDFILEEAIMNGCLIAVSGGVAFAARSAVSAGMRLALGSARIARLGRAAAVGGRFSGARNLLRLSKVGRYAIEGAVFETTYSGLQGEWIGNSPDWCKRILFASVGMAIFAKSMKFAEGFASKVGLAADKIKNSWVKKIVRQLLIDQNAATAAMVVLGAAEHGYVNGLNFEDFDWADQIFRAYVTAGALHIAHGAGGRVTARIGNRTWLAEAGQKFKDRLAVRDAKLADRAVGRAKKGVVLELRERNSSSGQIETALYEVVEPRSGDKIKLKQRGADDSTAVEYEYKYDAQTGSVELTPVLPASAAPAAAPAASSTAATVPAAAAAAPTGPAPAAAPSPGAPVAVPATPAGAPAGPAPRPVVAPPVGPSAVSAKPAPAPSARAGNGNGEVMNTGRVIGRKVAEHIRGGREIIINRSPAVEAILKNPEYNLEILLDGKIKVLGYKSGKTWVGEKPVRPEQIHETAPIAEALSRNRNDNGVRTSSADEAIPSEVIINGKKFDARVEMDAPAPPGQKTLTERYREQTSRPDGEKAGEQGKDRQLELLDQELARRLVIREGGAVQYPSEAAAIEGAKQLRQDFSGADFRVVVQEGRFLVQKIVPPAAPAAVPAAAAA